jgi:hypothetical protein
MEKRSKLITMPTKKKISVSEISKLAKQIRKPDEKWTAAIKRAAKQLK